MTRPLASAAIDTARSSHYVLNPVTGLYERALLLEGSRTNWCLHSADMSNAAWIKTNVTVTANAATAPDGTATADKVEATATASTLFAQQITTSGATTVSFSIFVKQGSGAAEANAFGLYNVTTGANIVFGTVNYGTLAVAYSFGSSGIAVEQRPDGWLRVTVTGTVTAGNTVNAYAGFTGSPVGAGQYAYLWGGQLEAGPFASSPIPTTTAAVTRSADALTFPYSATPAPLTLYVKFIERGTGQASDTLGLCSIGSQPSLFLFNTSNNVYRVAHRSAGGSDATATVPAAAGALGTLTELLVHLYDDGTCDIAQSLNAGTLSESALSATLPLPAAWSAETFYLGTRGGSSPGFAAFLAVKVAEGYKSIHQMRRMAPVS